MVWLSRLFGVIGSLPAVAAVRVWKKQELTFTSTHAFTNPYTDVIVWVDLSGSNFIKRVYGFWDGGPTFRARLLATELGLRA